MFETPLAYLDPGVGSMLIQVVVGSLCAGAYYFRRGLKPITEWFRTRKQNAA